MSSQYYSDLKAAWHIDRIAQLREGKQIAPVELQLVLSDLCNHDCFFCAYRASTGLSAAEFVEWDGDKRIHNPNRMIPQHKAVEILNDASAMGVKSVIFTGGGEPTAHPQHIVLFEVALDLGLQCSLNTNGALLRKGWDTVLPQFKYVRFSIDAGTPEEYAQVRRVPASQYRKTLENLRQVVDACRGTDCVVGTGYVVTPDNYVNVVDGVRNIRDTGAAYVRLASMQSTEGMAPYQGNEVAVRAYLEIAEREATDDFQVVNLFNLTQGRKAADAFCGMQQFVLYVGGNQKLYRCCYTAYSKLGEIGDLRQQSLLEWFHSPEKEVAIGDFDARDCATCPLEHKNATMRYMMDPEPPHVNFV